MDDYKRYVPDGTNTYPADINTLGIEPEIIIREAVNNKTDIKSKKEAPVDKREAMVDAQMITEMMDNKLQL